MGNAAKASATTAKTVRLTYTPFVLTCLLQLMLTLMLTLSTFFSTLLIARRDFDAISANVLVQILDYTAADPATMTRI